MARAGCPPRACGARGPTGSGGSCGTGSARTSRSSLARRRAGAASDTAGATGSTGVARGVPAAVAVGGILLNGLGAVVAGFAPFRYLSPIYWFLGDTPPLLRGFSAEPLVLLGAALVAVVIGVIGFERRDLAR